MEKAKSTMTRADMEKAKSASLSQGEPHPSPADLSQFLPWAATEYGFITPILVTKKIQVPPVPLKAKKSVKEFKSAKELYTIDKQSSSSNDSVNIKNAINILLSYYGEDVVHILFEKTKRLPREVLQIIQMVLEFNPLLYGITVNCGIDKYTLYELKKILSTSNITEICLNDTFVREGNYALLLEEANCLQILSLARCKFGDQVVKEIAEKLQHPLPASKKLLSLNLSSNSLTDKSAIYLATALRSNRKLSYLNVSGNMITDKGGEAFLNVFKPFPLTAEEQLEFKHRYMDYLKLKNTMIEDYMADLRAGGDKKNTKRDKKSVVSLKKRDDLTDKQADALLYEKAEHLVVINLGEFDDPMSESFINEGLRYSKGNNCLVHLNIAFNNLSQLFLKSLVKVLQYQHSTGKRIKSLMNVRIDGNPMPEACPELEQIELLIDYGFSAVALKKGSTSARKQKK